MNEPGVGEPEPSVPSRKEPSPYTGLAPNVAGALCYLLGPITGVLFLVLEKRDRFVRFHAAQSIGISVALIIFWVGYGIISTVLTAIPIVEWLVAIFLFLFSAVVGLAGIVLWLFLMYRAWSGDEWEIPWVGEHARRILLGS
jgi:uncharacterized membrane protein